MGISAKDRQYMHLALELAAEARGCTSPNPMVGCVVVLGYQIVGQGFHHRAGMPHAEVEALAEAGPNARGGTLYVNLEPCSHHGRTPPCVDAILEAGISRVVCAMVDPNPLVSGRGLRFLQSHGVEVDCGVLEGEARRLNEIFITYHMKKRPFVVAKWAMTLDGRTSTDSGHSRWISNEASRAYAHKVRSNLDAIGVGVGTIFFDDPKLTVRMDDYTRSQPKRVIFDGGLRVPIRAKCFDPTGGDTIVICSPNAAQEKMHRLRDNGHTVLEVPGRGRIVDVATAMKMLAEHGVQSILIEGGRQLHTSMLSAGLIDKIVVFMAPMIIGGNQLTSPLEGLNISKMKQAITLKNVKIQSFGSDVCLEGYVNLLPQLPKLSEM